MELLSRVRTSPALVAALALALGGGCMLVDALRAQRGLVFSHRRHVVEEKLECVSCHESAEVEEAPGMPSADSCAVCHDELDAELPPERTVAALFDAQGSYRGAHASALADEVVFSHLAHVGPVGACAACHREIDTNEAVDASVAVPMDDCQRCHAERQQPNECQSCHREVTRAWAPPSHARDWQKLHGRACRRNDPRPSDDCMLCHQESSCEQCHRVEAPQSHDQNFRLRGHALLARVDRTSCATCHEPALCDRCHADVLPVSHLAGTFGNTRNTHCLTCHFPLEGESCRTCHQATPSHADGPPKPSWHTPAMDCRSCHGSSLPLSHVDDGSNCNLCHP